MWALPACPTSGRSVELPRRLQAVEVFRIAVREHLCRVSARDRQRRNFAVDDRTGLDDRPLADLRARQQDDPRANPHEVADDHVLGDVGRIVGDRLAVVVVVVAPARTLLLMLKMSFRGML